MKDWKADLEAIRQSLFHPTHGGSARAATQGNALVPTTPPRAQDAPAGKLPTLTLRSGDKQGVPTPGNLPIALRRDGPRTPKGSSAFHPTAVLRVPIEPPKRAETGRPAAPAAKFSNPVSNQAGRKPNATSTGLSAPTASAKKAGPAPVPSAIRALRKLSPSRQKLFQAPENWVANGARTQLPDSSNATRSLDIVIGIDFGTAYTKAAVGMLDKIYPVDWFGTTSASSTLLLPSEYTQLTDGQVYLGQKPGAGEDEVKLDLKLPFIQPHVSTDSIARASVFLAAVLRYVRGWIFQVHGAKFGNAKVRWQLNLGAPSNGLENEKVVSAYKRLGLAAWQLSQRPIDANMADATQVVSSLSPGSKVPDLRSDAVSVFPEFVAQMAGYVQSPERQRGLHALADVGGGTLDVVTFIVHQVDHEDTFPFLVPEVHSLGTQLLNQNRMVGAPDSVDQLMPDALMPVLASQEFAAVTGLSPSHVQARDVLFSAQVENVVRKVFSATKASRYRLSEAWTTELRTFVTGGGASACGYSAAIERGGLSSARHIQLMQLPQHPRLADFDGTRSDYQRISVACGLAQDAFSLGRIVPAKDVENDRAIRAQVRQRPDRDELYAK